MWNGKSSGMLGSSKVRIDYKEFDYKPDIQKTFLIQQQNP